MVGTLDTINGVFELSTADMVTYPPGSYTVTISGSITGYPSQTNSHEFTYTLVDPCSLATVSVPTQTDPIEHTYTAPTIIQETFTPSDSRCTIEYECMVPASGNNICYVGTIDTTSGIDTLPAFIYTLPANTISTPLDGTKMLRIKGYITDYPD